MPVGAPASRRLCACAEVFHTLKNCPEGERHPRRRRGRRGRLRPQPEEGRGRPEGHREGHRGGRLQARRGLQDRHRRRLLRVVGRGQKCYIQPKSGKKLTQQQLVNMWKKFADTYPIISLEDGMAETDWEGWAMLTKAIGDQGPAGGRRPVRHQRGAPGHRHREEGGQRHPHQGQPDRHPDRDPGCHPDGQTGPATPPSCPTAPGRPRTPPSPTSPWLPTPVRSRPGPPAAPTAWPSTTSCSASREELGGARRAYKRFRQRRNLGAGGIYFRRAY